MIRPLGLLTGVYESVLLSSPRDQETQAPSSPLAGTGSKFIWQS